MARRFRRNAKKKRIVENPSETISGANLPPVAGELYNLADDLSETKNIAAKYPELVAEMSAKLAQIKLSGRSRP